MRGPSKECRFAQPLVSMYLVIDEHGFPLDFDLFPINRAEYPYLIQAANHLKKKYNLNKCIYVADRGLNSSHNLKLLQEIGAGFVVGQKVSNLKAEAEKEMLSSSGWQDLNNNHFFLDTLDPDYDPALDIVRFKEVDTVKKFKDPITKKTISVNCKVVYTFSPQRRQRELHDLDEQISKAQLAINTGKLMGNSNGSGWKSLINIANYKDNPDAYRATGLKNDVIAKRTRLAGYSSIVYYAPNGNYEMMTASQAISGYHHLYMIEDCFRGLKNNLDLRPVFLRKYEHIKGHFLICVLALITLKLISYKLKNIGYHVPIGVIQKTIQSYKVSALSEHMENIKRDVMLYVHTGTNKPFNEYFKKDLKNQTPIDKTGRTIILNLFGLDAPNITNSESELKQVLKIKKSHRVLNDIQLKQLKKA